MKVSKKRPSAGLLMYRRQPNRLLEVLLAHPGGPLFARKDEGAWSVPKGEIEAGENPHACALREFEEETGLRPMATRFLELGSIVQRSGKHVQAWGFEGDWPGGPPKCNTFELEWPPHSGRFEEFPEIDRVEFFTLERARIKINPAQVAFLDRLEALLDS
jgi:predicted NUDIX family NTP pyrophosphohydrolase